MSCFIDLLGTEENRTSSCQAYYKTIQGGRLIITLGRSKSASHIPQFLYRKRHVINKENIWSSISGKTPSSGMQIQRPAPPQTPAGQSLTAPGCGQTKPRDARRCKRAEGTPPQPTRKVRAHTQGAQGRRTSWPPSFLAPACRGGPQGRL